MAAIVAVVDMDCVVKENTMMMMIIFIKHGGYDGEYGGGYGRYKGAYGGG